MNISELKKARKRAGLTQEECADLIGVKPWSYLQREKGRRVFEINDIPILARALKLNIDEMNLIFFDNELPAGYHLLTEIYPVPVTEVSENYCRGNHNGSRGK